MEKTDKYVIDLASVDVFSILTDAIWRAHVAGTPQEFRDGLDDGLRHTSDVSRAAAVHILDQLAEIGEAV